VTLSKRHTNAHAKNTIKTAKADIYSRYQLKISVKSSIEILAGERSGADLFFHSLQPETTSYYTRRRNGQAELTA